MFVARRSFLYDGTQYKPNDVIKGFPEVFGTRAETFVRCGMIVEKPDKKPRKPVMEEIKAE